MFPYKEIWVESWTGTPHHISKGGLNRSGPWFYTPERIFFIKGLGTKMARAEKRILKASWKLQNHVEHIFPDFLTPFPYPGKFVFPGYPEKLRKVVLKSLKINRLSKLAENSLKKSEKNQEFRIYILCRGYLQVLQGFRAKNRKIKSKNRVFSAIHHHDSLRVGLGFETHHQQTFLFSGKRIG